MLTVYPCNQFGNIPASPGFDPAGPSADNASVHILYGSGVEVLARCSVWWKNTPTENNFHYGAIGHFQAQEVTAATAVLAEACRLLKEHGCAAALAPMDGNTWRSYRYATGGSERAPFLLEPPPAAGRDVYLAAAGFLPAHTYASYIGELPREAPAELPGLCIRPLDMQNLEQELDLIYNLAVLAFRENPYYTDLPREDFIRQYLTLGPRLVPQLVLLAYIEEQFAGFLFCLPDYTRDSAPPKTLLLKTMAIDPAFRGRGIGGFLMKEARYRALQLGFTHAIEALVYRGNISERFCRSSKLLREYTLYRRTL